MVVTLAILNDSAPVTEKTVLDGILLDFPGILTVEKGNLSLGRGN